MYQRHANLLWLFEDGWCRKNLQHFFESVVFENLSRHYIFALLWLQFIPPGPCLTFHADPNGVQGDEPTVDQTGKGGGSNTDVDLTPRIPSMSNSMVRECVVLLHGSWSHSDPILSSVIFFFILVHCKFPDACRGLAT